MQTNCNYTAQCNDESRLYRFSVGYSTKTLQNENENILSGTCVLHFTLIGWNN